MLQINAMEKAKQAAIAVLDTLTYLDYAQVVLFNSTAVAFDGTLYRKDSNGNNVAVDTTPNYPTLTSSNASNGTVNQLMPMTDANRALLKEYIESISASSTTNFENSLNLAFDIINNLDQIVIHQNVSVMYCS